MADFEGMYYTLFNQLSRAIEAMEQMNFGTARELLIRAQQEGEELFLQEE